MPSIGLFDKLSGGKNNSAFQSALDMPDLSGKNIVVTGANSGIGQVAATEFARKGARVYP
jgi:NADPH:quinone reductase-like Zn-dependent oxidoreductase